MDRSSDSRQSALGAPHSIQGNSKSETSRAYSEALLTLGWTASRHVAPKLGCRNPNWRPFVSDLTRIAIAAAQLSISSVPVKSAEQKAAAMLLSVRELLVRQRTQLVNALRGHAAEGDCRAAR